MDTAPVKQEEAGSLGAFVGAGPELVRLLGASALSGRVRSPDRPIVPKLAV